MVDDNIPKKPRSVAHLKKFQFGQPGRPKGRPSGAKSKKAALTAEILVDAFLIDPDTGSKMSAKALRHRLAKKIWSGDSKVLLDVISRKLGPVISQATIVQVPTFNIISQVPEPKQLDNGTANNETYVLPGSSDDVSSDND